MKLNLPVRDLFSHMVMLGLAQIVEEDEVLAGHVTVCWRGPQTAELAFLDGSDVALEDVSKAVWRFKEGLLSQSDTIRQTIDVKTDKGSAKHSPLSPRIAKDLTGSEWADYFELRTSILDEVSGISPLFVRLVNALGFPSYWSRQKNKANLDNGASLWEMAPRNSGSEFFRNKYLSLLDEVSAMSAEDIAVRLRGEERDARGKDRNTSGLHRPALTDVCLSWIAYHGLAIFPVRPATKQERGSVSVGVLDASYRDRRFVLPVPEVPITLGRYAAICRFDGLYRLAAELGSSSGRPSDASLSTAHNLEKDVSWLKSHGTSWIITFERYVGGSDSCPEYYALEGSILPLTVLDARS